MNRLIYLIPLASFPLMAVAEQGADGAMKTDNPYVAAALVFAACLTAAVALAGYFNLRKRGRIASGVVFGLADFIVTGPICLSAGLGARTSASVATLSAVLLVFVVVRYGDRLASFFKRRRVESSENDSEKE